MSPIARSPQRSALATAALGLLGLGGCVAHLFSGEYYPDQTRPIARIETRGGVEYGATTSIGILFLGRTATEGPCRVHYFLGSQLVTEPGRIEQVGGLYYRAAIDLKHQTVNPLPRALRPDDELCAIVLDGSEATRVPVTLARGEGIEGDLLEEPERPLPAGAGLFRIDPDDERLQFVGLVAGTATLETDGTRRRLVVFTGLDRLREALLVPQRVPEPTQVKYRPDGIWLREPIPKSETDDEQTERKP
jgi:hypothetical protein